MASTPGTSLGLYEVLEPLGSGGMGDVYRARDPRLGREVAIKLLSAQGAPSLDQLRRFETEARAVASLSHPNVVTLFDVGTHDGVPYLVLELLDGPLPCCPTRCRCSAPCGHAPVHRRGGGLAIRWRARSCGRVVAKCRQLVPRTRRLRSLDRPATREAPAGAAHGGFGQDSGA